MYLVFTYLRNSQQCTWAKAKKKNMCTRIGISLQYKTVNFWGITLLNILNHFKVVSTFLPQLVIIKLK